MNQLVSFKLGVVEELLLTTFHAADEHAFAMGHLVLAERAMVWELLEAVLDVALVDTRAWLHAFELVVALRVI